MAFVVPMPVNAMVCVGLPGSLSVSVIAPLRVPAADGVKVTVIVQFCPALRVAGVVGQVWLWKKSPLLTMLVKVTE